MCNPSGTPNPTHTPLVSNHVHPLPLSHTPPCHPSGTLTCVETPQSLHPCCSIACTLVDAL